MAIHGGWLATLSTPLDQSLSDTIVKETPPQSVIPGTFSKNLINRLGLIINSQQPWSETASLDNNDGIANNNNNSFVFPCVRKHFLNKVNLLATSCGVIKGFNKVITL